MTERLVDRMWIQTLSVNLLSYYASYNYFKKKPIQICPCKENFISTLLIKIVIIFRIRLNRSCNVGCVVLCKLQKPFLVFVDMFRCLPLLFSCVMLPNYHTGPNYVNQTPSRYLELSRRHCAQLTTFKWPEMGNPMAT